MSRREAAGDERAMRVADFGADLMASMARLFDKYPEQIQVITSYARDWIEVNGRPRSDEMHLSVMSRLDLPKLQDAILGSRDCRKALDAITDGYGRLPSTADTRLAKTSGHSIGGAVFVGLVLGTVIAIAIVGISLGGSGGSGGGGDSGAGGSGGGDSSGGTGGGDGGESEGEGSRRRGGDEGESEGEGHGHVFPGGRRPGGGESEGEGRRARGQRVRRIRKER